VSRPLITDAAVPRMRLITALAFLLLPCTATAQQANLANTDQLRATLASPSFQERQQALLSLQNVIASADGLQQVRTLLQNDLHPDAARRIIELTGRVYASRDYRDPLVRSASEILEQQAESASWFVAEASTQILNQAWRRRVEIAVGELIALGVPLEPRDPRKLWENPAFGTDPRVSPTSDQSVRIYLDEHWPGTPECFALLSRLKLLATSTRIGFGRVHIYQIDGHPLSQEDIAALKGLFGDLRVQTRGRVCLGILQDGFAAVPGVPVGSLSPGGSAANAGIQRGDVIVAMNGRDLLDFDELVTRLREFRIGDKIQLKVVRGGIPRVLPSGIPQPNSGDAMEIEVTLQGWYAPKLLDPNYEEPPADQVPTPR
jgi:hypothetical protein